MIHNVENPPAGVPGGSQDGESVSQRSTELSRVISDASRHALTVRGVSLEHAERVGVRAARTAADLPAGAPARWAGLLPALIFPWTDHEGTTWQIRPDSPRMNGSGKIAKYLLPKAEESPPRAWLIKTGTSDGERLIVEGTVQTVAAAQYAPASTWVIGIFGCRGWQRDKKLLPLLALAAQGADVVITMDKDRETNSDVRKATEALASAMSEHGATSVRLVTLPGQGKDGLDDVLASVAPDERAGLLAQLIEEAVPAPVEDARLAAEVADQVRRLRVASLAREQLAREIAGEQPDPAQLGVSLTELLEEEDTDPPWRIEGLWPSGGNVLLSAQAKSGKTTLTGNVVRCLVDGSSLLSSSDALDTPGSHLVEGLEPGECVVIVDLELDRRMLRRWLCDHGIQNADSVHVVPLRGMADAFDLTDQTRLSAWADRLRELNTKVLIIDPLGPLMAQLGVEENDNHGVSRLFLALDALKAKAGVSELLAVHHMGHGGERARGASRFRGWPDAEWLLTREESDTGPNAARFFASGGRDTAVPERRLAYDPRSRRLSLAGGNRREYATLRLSPYVAELVIKRPGLNVRDIESSLRAMGPRSEIRAGVAGALESGEIHVHEGPRRAILHYPGGECASAPECAAHTGTLTPR